MVTDSELLTIRLLWAALLISQAILVVLGVLLVPAAGPVPWWRRLGEPLPLIFAMLSLTQFALAFNIHRVLPGAPSQDLAGRARTFVILRMALLESVAVFGLVTALLAGQLGLMLPFVAASVLASLLSFPTERLLRHHL